MKKGSFLKNYGFLICMLIGIVAGCIVGAIWPATKDASGEILVKGATVLEPLGTVFLNLMFCIAVPTVFCSISSAIANMQSAKRAGKIMGVTIATFLATAAIAPAYKRQGYGKQLLDYSMEKAREMGAGALAITGNILFYGKSGFVPAKTRGVRYADDPEADYFLIRELTPGFLDGISGTYKDPEGYFVCEKDPEGFERFEATFPKKEKRKLPGQLF